VSARLPVDAAGAAAGAPAPDQTGATGTKWIRDEQPDHISESLETIFWVKLKIVQFLNT
jgi:hypothetical protein